MVVVVDLVVVTAAAIVTSSFGDVTVTFFNQEKTTMMSKADIPHPVNRQGHMRRHIIQ